MTAVLAVYLAPFVVAWLASCVVAIYILCIAIKGRFSR